MYIPRILRFDDEAGQWFDVRTGLTDDVYVLSSGRKDIRNDELFTGDVIKMKDLSFSSNTAVRSEPERGVIRFNTEKAAFTVVLFTPDTPKVSEKMLSETLHSLSCIKVGNIFSSKHLAFEICNNSKTSPNEALRCYLKGQTIFIIDEDDGRIKGYNYDEGHSFPLICKDTIESRGRTFYLENPDVWIKELMNLYTKGVDTHEPKTDHD